MSPETREDVAWALLPVLAFCALSTLLGIVVGRLGVVL